MRYASKLEFERIESFRLGRLSGLKEGTEMGVEIGMERGLIEGISLALEAKFRKRGLNLLPHVEKLELAKLRELMGFLATADSLPEVRKHLTISENQS